MSTNSTIKMDQEKSSHLNRTFDGSISLTRSEESGEGIYLLSFSSEQPYMRWFGNEILDHSEKAVNLDRLNSIGCVLFNHHRDDVIGRIHKAWVDNGKGYAEISFDDDEFSQKIKNKVDTKTLTGVSVGYSVDAWEEVLPGKTSTDGFAGPCQIARSWFPYEISIVSVPADETVGVGRMLETNDNLTNLDFAERQIQINKNY